MILIGIFLGAVYGIYLVSLKDYPDFADYFLIGTLCSILGALFGGVLSLAYYYATYSLVLWLDDYLSGIIIGLIAGIYATLAFAEKVKESLNTHFEEFND